MFKEKLKNYRHYIFYSSSILFGRGLEYLWFFIISYYATKEQYGTFEFYRKIIEFIAVFASFGFPALILTYAKDKNEKNNFFIAGMFLSFSITIITGIILFLLGIDYLILIVPILFYSIFHYSNSIYQAYNLVQKGSKYASLYKTIVSILFTISILLFFFFIEEKEFSIIYCTFPLLLLGLIYFAKDFDLGTIKHGCQSLMETIRLQYVNGGVLFLTTVANTFFLTIDVLIIGYYSGTSTPKLAEYNFPLVLASTLLIIPMTITSVDIENYKQSHSKFLSSLKKNTIFTLIASVFVFGFYIILINSFYPDYKNTVLVFSIILVAKILQSITIPYGIYLGTKGIFIFQFKVLLLSLGLNTIFSLLLYNNYGLVGIACISFLSLLIRFIFYYKKFNKLYSIKAVE